MRRSEFVATTVGAGASFALQGPTTGPVVKIGFIDSTSGPYIEIARRHRAGAEIALEEANASSRIRHVLVPADDSGRPAAGAAEANRLIHQEKVDVLLHGTSSSVAIVVAAAAQENGVFMLSAGASSTALTGSGAHRVLYRLAPNSNMSADAIVQRMLESARAWFFIVTDNSFGHDGHTRLVAKLKHGGGAEAGSDVVQVGAASYQSSFDKLRTSTAGGVVLCQPSSDASKAAKQFCLLGLSKAFKLAGIDLEDFEAQRLACDELAGSIFSVHWSPSASESAARLAGRLRHKLNESVSWRHYLGYTAMRQLIDRMHGAGTTDTEKLVEAFADGSFDAFKTHPARWRSCDHQCAQDEYAGVLLSAGRRAQSGSTFDIVDTLAPQVGQSACSEPSAVTARRIILSEPIAARASYQSLRL